jgi:hypothetical protein
MRRSGASRPWVFLLLILLAISLVVKAGNLIVPTSTWISTGNMAQARVNVSAVTLQDGRILIAGGDGGSGPAATAEFMATDGTTSSAPQMSVAREGHISVVLLDGRVLAAGGITSGGGVTNSAEIFDPVANSWTPISGGMIEARTAFTATLLSDGRVLIAGGRGPSGNISSTVEIFDPMQGQFSFAAVLASPRAQHAAALLQDGRVLIIGGFNGSVPLASTDIFDPRVGAISAGPSLAVGRFGHSATTLLNGEVAVIGGNNGNNDPAQTDATPAELFDPMAGTFTTLTTNLATPREGHLAFLLPNNNNILIVGGTSAGRILASTELFSSQESSQGIWNYRFSVTGSMMTARSSAAGAPNQVNAPSSVVQRNGIFMIVGGSDTTGNAVSSTEAYGYSTIQSDQTDYPPGTAVTITGRGWQPGETVALTLVESPLVDTHGPFTVQADPNGNISNNSFVTDQHDASIRFYLTATGASSGFQAQTTFTDAIKLYEATISPTGDTAGHASANYAVTLANDPTSTNDIASATIAVPSAYSSVSLGTVTTSPGGLHWTASLTSGIITIAANTGPDHLSGGQSVTLAITATAPCTDNTYTWTTVTAGNFTIVGSQPSVTISGSCIVPTTLVLNSVNPNSVAFDSAGPVTFTATLTRNDTSVLGRLSISPLTAVRRPRQRPEQAGLLLSQRTIPLCFLSGCTT